MHTLKVCSIVYKILFTKVFNLLQFNYYSLTYYMLYWYIRMKCPIFCQQYWLKTVVAHEACLFRNILFTESFKGIHKWIGTKILFWLIVRCWKLGTSSTPTKPVDSGRLQHRTKCCRNSNTKSELQKSVDNILFCPL